jgi:hypothetical protein
MAHQFSVNLKLNFDWFKDAITSKYKLHTELNKNIADNDLRLYLAFGASLINVKQ